MIGRVPSTEADRWIGCAALCLTNVVWTLVLWLGSARVANGINPLVWVTVTVMLWLPIFCILSYITYKVLTCD